MVAQLLNILEQLFNCSRTIFSHNTLSRLAKAFLRIPVVTLSDFLVRLLENPNSPTFPYIIFVNFIYKIKSKNHL